MNDSVRLIISPGVRVEVQGNYLITVNGWISCNGIASDSVIFDVGGAGVEWKGIFIDDPTQYSDSILFRYCSFKKCTQLGALRLNLCWKLIVDHCTFKNCIRVNGDGGAIYLYVSRVVIQNSRFENNLAQGHGGAIMVESATSASLYSTAYISGNTFLKNECYAYGGAIYCYRGSQVYRIENNVFRENTGARGGAIACISVKPDILSNTISDNLADAHEGGGVFLNSASSLIQGNILDSNIAYSPSFQSMGGAVFAMNSSPKIYDNFIRGNRSQYGAVGCTTNTHAEIKGNIIADNWSSGVGAIHAENGSSGTSSSNIDSNYIDGNSGLWAVNLQCLNNSFRYNTVDSNAAIGLYIKSSSVSGSSIALMNTVSRNTSIGIRAANATLESNSIYGNAGNGIMGFGSFTVKIIGNTIKDNAESGINFYSGITAIIRGNRIYGNTTTGKGGGLTTDGITLTFVNNEVRNNVATHGGGLYLKNSGSYLTGNLISNNTASSQGGGIFTENDAAIYQLTNNTVANNFAGSKGGGLYHYAQSIMKLHSCNFYGNAAGSGPQMLFYYDNYDPKFYHCNIQGGVTAVDWNSGSFTGTNTSPFDTLPHFTNPASGSGSGIDTNQSANWVLLTSSPLIDSGYADTNGLFLPSTDLYGKARIQNSVIDIGATESTTPFSYSMASLNLVVCDNDSLRIAGNANWSTAAYQWYFNGSPLTGQMTDSLIIFPTDSLHGGLYRLRAVYAGDTGWSDSIHVAIMPLPSVTWNTAQATCSNAGPVTLTGASPAGGSYAGVGVSASVFSPSVAGPGSHILVYVYSDSNQCSDSAQNVFVVHQPLSFSGLGTDTVICPGDSLMLDAGPGFTDYDWSTSDSSQSILVSSTGQISVMLTDSNSCMQGDTILVYVFTPVVFGIVRDSALMPVDSAKIYMLKFNPADTTVSVLDSVISNGLGEFSIIQTEALVYLKVYADSGRNPDMLPTYQMSSPVFQDADDIPIDSCDISMVMVKMIHGVNPGGSGFMGGKVVIGNGVKAVGDPAAGTKFILMNRSLRPVAVATADADGYFSFGNLAADSYYVWVDKPFIENQHAPLIVLGNGQVIDSLEFILHRNYLELLGSTGVTLIESLPEIQMYPNPAGDELILAGREMKEVSITNLKGILLLSVKDLNTNLAELDISGLPDGLYIVRIQMLGGMEVRRLVVSK